MAVTDTPKKSNMAAIIMQIRRPLTLRLIIFIHIPICLLCQNMNFIDVLLPKMKIMVAPTLKNCFALLFFRLVAVIFPWMYTENL